jgi:hypothetical protein
MENLIKGQKYNVATQFSNYTDLIFVGYEKENADVVLAVFQNNNDSDIYFDISMPENIATLKIEIGQKVKWTVGNVESQGVVLEDKGEYTDVITHFIGGARSNMQVEVLTELLIKVN